MDSAQAGNADTICRTCGRALDQIGRQLLRSGDARLTDLEMLALCLAVPAAGREDLNAALRAFGNLAGLLAAAPGQLLAQPGLGPMRVARLKAVVALSARASEAELADRPIFSSNASVARFLRHQLAGQRREVFACLFLDARHRLISFEQLFLGTVDRASVHPREILRRALELNAAAMILAHNHPSGIAEPSSSDVALTRDLSDLLGRIEVRILDHIVVGRGREVSFAERGLL